MRIPTNREDHRQKLIEKILSQWTSEDLLEYARQHLDQKYKKSPILFRDDWIEVFSEENKLP